MRELKFTFGVRNCSYEKWSGLISQIASDIQGVEKRIILDTDKGFYYVGRCKVDTSKSNDVTAEIAVTCTCEPYKISVASSDEPWKWDTFNFLNGVIRNTSDITISSASGWQKVTLDGWIHNETLRIVSNAEMKVDTVIRPTRYLLARISCTISSCTKGRTTYTSRGQARSH